MLPVFVLLRTIFAAQIDVDVFRRVAPARSEPWAGASSFMQEHLVKWRESNSAEHFLRAEAALRPLTQSLAQLVHHKEQVRGAA
eukprot:16150-Chlamydomonas_euryale.AAC.2